MTGDQFKVAMAFLLGERWMTARAADLLGVKDVRAVQRMAAGDVREGTAAEIKFKLIERRDEIDALLLDL